MLIPELFSTDSDFPRLGEDNGQKTFVPPKFQVKYPYSASGLIRDIFEKSSRQFGRYRICLESGQD